MTAVPPAGGALPAGIPAELAHLLLTANLRVELDGRRADVVLADAARRNAQTPATWRALAATGTWLRGLADVVVLRAEGPTFSAGLDRRALTPDGVPGEFSLAELADLDGAALDARIASYQDGFAVWGQGPFLTVAAVHGHAVGAGFQLALACDLRIAADDAVFAMREPALGLVPDLGGTRPLVDAVGYARALEICATARWVDAAEAVRIGLVQAVVPAAGLGSAIGELVAAITANDPAAVLATRALLRGAAGRTPGEQRAAERAAQADRVRELARRLR